MKVAIIGTGYVGLVTGACLADRGHEVVCVDNDPDRLVALSAGRAPFFEPGLEPLLEKGFKARHLAATGDLAKAVDGAAIVMICVGTPSTEDGIDLGAVLTAARQIGEQIAGRADYPVVTVKSTVVPGTTGGPVRAALEETSGMIAGQGFGLAMNPEFLSQGSAVRDFSAPGRIVVGGVDLRSAETVRALYDGFDCPMIVTNLVNAEMAKYAANAFQATLISFANQIGAICERLPGADEATVMSCIHQDAILRGPTGEPVAATRFLKAGIGFGGSCFPKDLVALQAFARRAGAATRMLDAVIATNRARVDEILAMLKAELGEIEGRTIAVFGLAFKPDTDDLRESPGIHLAERLHGAGATVHAHDPLEAAREAAGRRLPGDIAIAERADRALAGADAALIATAWPAYTAMDWPGLAATMRRPLVIDGRGVLAEQPPGHPVVYRRIGVGPAARA